MSKLYWLCPTRPTSQVRVDVDCRGPKNQFPQLTWTSSEISYMSEHFLAFRHITRQSTAGRNRKPDISPKIYCATPRCSTKQTSCIPNNDDRRRLQLHVSTARHLARLDFYGAKRRHAAVHRSSSAARSPSLLKTVQPHTFKSWLLMMNLCIGFKACN